MTRQGKRAREQQSRAQRDTEKRSRREGGRSTSERLTASESTPEPSERRQRSRLSGETTRAGQPDPDKLANQQERGASRREEDMERKYSPTDMQMDDDEEEEHVGRGHSALQGLLRRLGASFEDVIHGGSSSGAFTSASGPQGARVRAAMGQIRSPDPSDQLAGLTDLCDYLSVSTEESLLSFPSDTAVPLLIKCLNSEIDPDVALLAARALTFLADVSGPCAGAVIRHGAPAALVARLLNIEYIDLAEQALQAIQKLAAEHPAAMLRAGALPAVLAYVDFFPLGVQRAAVGTAATLCSALGHSTLESATGALPALLGLLQSGDAGIAESAGRALARMVDRYVSDPSPLSTLCGLGLASGVAAVVRQMVASSTPDARDAPSSPGPMLGVATVHALLRLLTRCAESADGEPCVAVQLVEAGMADCAAGLLAGSQLLLRSSSGIHKAGEGSIQSPGASSALVRTPDQAAGVVALLEALLPLALRVEEEEEELVDQQRGGDQHEDYTSRSGPHEIGHLTASMRFSAGSSSRSVIMRTPSAARASHRPATVDVALRRATVDVALRTWCQAHPENTALLAQKLLPALLRLCEATSGARLKAGCLRAFARVLAAAPKESVCATLLPLPVSSTVASLLRASNDELVARALALAELLVEILPNETPAAFAREGVLYELGRLARVGEEEEEPEEVVAGSGRPITTTRGSGLPTEGDNESFETHQSSSRKPSSIARRASRLMEQGQLRGGQLGSETEAVRKLRALAHRVREERDQAAFFEIVHILSTGSGNGQENLDRQKKPVSTFELAVSGALDAALWYVVDSGTGPAAVNDDDDNGHGSRSAATRHQGPSSSQINLLMRLAYLVAEDDAALLSASPGHRRSGAIETLAAGALAALEQTERLRVPAPLVPPTSPGHDGSWLSAALSALGRGHHMMASSSALTSSGTSEPSLLAGLDALGTPLNVRLCRAAEESTVRDHGTSIVSVVPLVTLDQLEEFLWPRVCMDDRERSAVRPISTTPAQPSRRLTRAQARVAAEDEVAAQGAQNSASRREALSSGEEMGSDDDSIEEEPDSEAEDLVGEEVAVRTVDLEEAGTPPLSPTGSMLSAQASLSPSQSPRVGRSRASRGRSSYAVALAGETPHLSFFLGTIRLSRSKVLLRALREAYELRGGSAAGQRLWGDIHHITYRPYKPEEDASDDDEEEERRAEENDALCSWAAEEGCAELFNQAGSSNEHSVLLGKPTPATLRALLSPAFGSTSAALSRDVRGNASRDSSDDGVGGTAVSALCLLRALAALDRLRSPLLRWRDSEESVKAKTTTLPVPVSRPTLFVSTRLTSKVSAALSDVTAVATGQLPGWVAELSRVSAAHGAILPFEFRRHIFQSTELGASRAIALAVRAVGAEEDRRAQGGAGQLTTTSGSSSGAALASRLARVPRQKVRLSRHRLLESATKVFNMPGTATSILEVEFHGEAGTGLGPTLEFYALVAHELRSPAQGLWRPDDKGGLYPMPLSPSTRGAAAEVKRARFRLAGAATAKALQDGRLFDLPLAPLFWRQLLWYGAGLTSSGSSRSQKKRAITADLADLASIDPVLASGLRDLLRHDSSTDNDNSNRSNNPSSLTLEDLCIPADVLPGWPEYRLPIKERGTLVSHDNVDSYVAAVVDASVCSGVSRQVRAFAEGFTSVLPLAALRHFLPEEMELLVCGDARAQAWDAEQLWAALRCDHGYTTASAPVRWLVEVLCELDDAQHRAFLSFATGAPRLPPGGFAALRPALTVVRKADSSADGGTPRFGTPRSAASSGGLGSARNSEPPIPTRVADAVLPSVMTCANYIKLPPYSSKEVLRERLLFVLEEGQGSFDLS